MKKLLDWFDHRTGYREILHETLYENIPGGARWRYVWGSTLVFTFFLQVITGILLWMAYSPSAQTAWESVYFIQTQMTLGWMIRGIHHFAAQAMVVLMAIHLMQVIIDGAYKAPREVNFWLGIVLMMIVLGLSLTGYLLPWDQKGYYATKVATNIMGVTPVIGTQLQEVVQGGPEYGHHTLTRFFALHAGVLPGLLVGFLVLHLYVFRRHGIHAKDPNKAPNAPFWPDQILKDSVACLGVLAIVMLLAIYKGAELSAPADPAEPYSAARPEWYFLFLFRFLKFESIDKIGLEFGAIYVPGALMAFLILMPLIAIWRYGHKLNVAFTFLILAGVIGLTGLAIYEDYYSDTEAALKFRSDVANAHKDAKRTMELAGNPETGIPVTGAVSLLRNDPLTQGPKLFAKKCASCHRYDGHDGTGHKVLVEGKEAPATATDLATIGTREWARSVLVDYHELFAPLKNATKDGENLGDMYLEGDMGTWSSDNRELLLDPENAETLAGLVEFLAAQSERADLAPFDEELVAKGLDTFENGTIAKGELSMVCADCHAVKPVGADDVLGTTEYGPELTGYGGRAWLRSFIANPGAPEHYGSTEHNAMPAFEKSLREQEIDLIARWLIGDYYKSKEQPQAPEQIPAAGQP
ncbi:MAG TPA: cytochrome b N-terminal domain-containing protein [Planctomycetaceae bacterium]|nr:cytochrome b N-terminal domain-containing protein [Planctomycetaceae bacterium]